MFCNDCGRKIEPGEKFCSGCGTSVESAAAAKKGGSSHRLKIIGIVGAVVLIIVVVALLGGGTGSAAGPEGTIRSWYREAERLNAGKQADLFVQEDRAGVAMTLEMTYAAMDSFSISNLRIRITSTTQDTAEAVAEYDWSYKVKDGSVYSEKGEVDHLKLVRVGGKWLIQETDFIFG